jgi:hypothetical protein
MLGTPRIYLRFDIPLADGTRTVTIVAHEPVEFFEAGERPSPMVEDRLLELMVAACRKVGMRVRPSAIVVDRVEDDEVWCDVEDDVHRPSVAIAGLQARGI